MGRKETQGIKLVKRKDSPYLHIKGTLFNERVRQSTGTTSKEEATLILNDIVSQLKRKHVYGEEDSVVDFSELEKRIKTIKEEKDYDLCIFVHDDCNLF